MENSTLIIKIITGANRSHIRVRRSITPITDRHKHERMQTHTTAGCDRSSSILSAPSTSCVKTFAAAAAQEVPSSGKDAGVIWDDPAARAELKEKGTRNISINTKRVWVQYSFLLAATMCERDVEKCPTGH